MQELLPLVFLLTLSGIIAGSEIAIFTLTESRIHMLVEQKVRGASTIKKLKKSPDKFLITIIIGNSIAITLASSLSTYWATERFGSTGIGIATVVISLAVLTYSEILPKSLAARYPAQFAGFFAWFINILMIVLTPVILVFMLIINFFNKIIGSRGQTINEKKFEAEVLALTKMGIDEGQLENYEHEIIENIFDLNDTKTKEIMIPKDKVITINGELTILEAYNQALPDKYSRIPVYVGKEGNIIGYLYVKDILKQTLDDWGKIKIKDIVREPIEFNEDTYLDDVYRTFIDTKTHIAMVKSKGKFKGIITFEDVLEEFLDEIDDEKDRKKRRKFIELKNQIVSK